MGTVRDLLTKSFKLSRIIGAGEVPDSEEVTDALGTLNGIIEQANIEKLFGYYKTTISFPTVASKAAYTIGPASTTPDITAIRPVEIINGYSRRGTSDLSFIVDEKEDYDNISLKAVTPGGWVQHAYYQAAWPKATIYLWPTPADTITTVFLSVMAEVGALYTIDDTISLPPAYETWLKYKLAERLSPEFGLTFSDANAKILIDIESAIKSNNIKPMTVMDSGLTSLGHSSGGRYDAMSDTTR